MRYAAFLLLLVAVNISPVSAGCAWVLWSHVYENGEWHWDIVSALDNREECTQKLRTSA